MSARNARALQFLLGAVALLAIWELVGRLELFGPTWPTLTAVLAEIYAPGRAEFFAMAAYSTAWSAAGGLLIGGAAALLLATLRQVVRVLAGGLDRFAATLHAVPHIAIAPVLIVSLGRAEAPMAIAALAAFFPAYVASAAAFSASAGVRNDLFSVLGSGRLQRLMRLQIPTALPGLLDALRLGAPGALLGAILGEWFGAPSGVGLVIVSSAQNFQIEQLWAAALLATVMSIVAFGFFSLLQHAARRRLT